MEDGKIVVPVAIASNPLQPDACNMSTEVDELERQAVEELLSEAKRAKERSKTMGTYGWQVRKATTNKRFLHNTLVSTLREYTMHSRHHQKSHGRLSTMKSSKWSQSDQEEGTFLSGSLAVFQESNHNSKSSSDSPAVDNREGHLFRVAGDDESLSKEEDKELPQMTREDKRPHYYYDQQNVNTVKHSNLKRSKSPLIKEFNNDQRHGHERHHHGHRERSESAKHKKKSKHRDKHLRNEDTKRSKSHRLSKNRP